MAGPWEAYQQQAPSGPWQRYGTQVKQAPPGYSTLGPKAEADLQQTQLGVEKTKGTLAADEQTANAQAKSATIKANQDQEQWNISHPSASGDDALSGPAYMQHLQKTDPGRAAYIQGLAEGRVPFPGAQMMRSPAGQALLTQVMRADPTMDATNYATRAAARKNAAVGTLSQSDNALVTAIGHAARLHSLVPEVFGTGATPFNSIANAVQGNLLNGKQPAYDQNAQLLGDEVAQAYGGSAQGDRKNAAGQFSSSLSTDQKNGNIRGAIDLMLSKLAANRAQFAYGNGGVSKPDFMLLPPNVRDELKQAGATDLAQKYFAGVPVMGESGTGTTPPPFGTKELGPEQKAQFFDILQHQGADAANQYLSQFGQQMKDKSAASKPYSQELQQPKPGSYADSYLSQGMSGVNTGVASTLGAPVDLMTSAMNLVPAGINAIANTHIPGISDPVGGGEWWKHRLSDVGSILPPSAQPSKQFTRRVGESVGASAIPAFGMGGSAAKVGMGLLSGLGGGIGGATAQQIAPGNTLAELAGEAVGGGLTGLGSLKAARRSAQREIEANVPSISDLKSQASDLYQKAETNGVVATPEQTQGLADSFRKTMLDEGQLGPKGQITNADTNTNKAFNLIQQYAGQEMKPKEMNTVRSVLADSRNSPDASDRRLGNILLGQFDDFVSPLAPEFGQARDVSSRYLQAQDLEKARELAGARASQFTGSGFENALRTEYRGLDRGNIKGNNYFGPEVTDAIENVARGNGTSNFFRGLGRLAPTGPVSGMGSVVPAMSLGAMTGSPAVGGAVGTGLAGAGILGRIGATRMGIHAADQAELIARNGGALEQAPLIPKSLADYAAWLAASQQPKYIDNSPQR